MAALHQGSGLVCGVYTCEQKALCGFKVGKSTTRSSSTFGNAMESPEFDSNGGTLLLRRKLASSRTLPNTAAILQQYLGFKRRPGKSMANFLVRETLGYEEFAEALQGLWEEHGRAKRH